MGFEITLTNVLMMLFYIIPGFLICKMKKASADHLQTASAMLVYGCSPFLVMSSFIALDFSWQILINMGLFFAVTLVLQIAFLGILYVLLKNRFDDARYRVFTVASTMGNVGFFGLPLVKALLPNNPEVMCYSAVYAISMNLIMFTMGVFCLTRNKKFMTPKAAIFNPTMLGLVIGLPLFILGSKAFLPDVLVSGFDLLGKMSAPLCMIILGVRLATVKFTELFKRPFVYIACAGKLIVFLLFCYLAVCFLPLDLPFKASVLILSGTPCASVVFNLSEMYQSEPELSANCVLVSTLLCFMTLPLLTLLL